MGKFQHAVDRSAIPTVTILGVQIADINMQWLLQFTDENIKKIGGDYICVANVHTTVRSSENEDYRTIQNNSLLTIPDGGPLSTVGRKRGATQIARTTGPDFMGEIFKLSAEKGYRHYFYGSTPETLEKMINNLQRNYPGIIVAGSFSPPFREISDAEDNEITKRSCDTAPDFIWVGLGAPKQEKWMAAHQGRVNGLMVGVGAGFDYFAGNISRAPAFMQNHNLEWLYRLFQEPRRLFKRYLVTNSKFIWRAIIRGK